MCFNNDNTVRNLFLLLIPMLYVSLGTMINVYTSSVPYIDWVRLFISLIGLMILFKSFVFVRFQETNFLYTILWLGILILLSTFFKNIDAFRPESVREISDSIMWMLVLILAYNISYQSIDIFDYIPKIAWIIPLYTFVFLNVRGFLINSEETAMISTAYYPMMLLPFVLLNKNIIIRWGLIVLTFITILLSSKRGGFIALFLGLATYYYVSYVSQRSIARKIFSILCGVFILFLLINFTEYYVALNDLTILERLSYVDEDGGSGRDVVWKHTWSMITNSSIPQLLFGHGFNAVYSDSVLKLSAHNDFLEIIYDYGFVGLLLFITLYIKLWHYYKKIKDTMPDVAGPFAASIIIALSISMVAHLVIHPILFMFLCMFWGFCIAECDKRQDILDIYD